MIARKNPELAINISAIFFIGMAFVFLIFRQPIYSVISTSLALGIFYFRQSKGMALASSGPIIFATGRFFENNLVSYIGIAAFLFGFSFAFFELWNLKGEIRDAFLEEEHIERDTELDISYVWDFRIGLIARKTFGTHLNPSKTAVFIRYGGERELYFYDIHSKTFCPAKGELTHSTIFGRISIIALVMLFIILMLFIYESLHP